MGSTTVNLLQSICQKGSLVLLHFLDDAILLGLTRVGVSLPWLHWLSLVLFIGTLVYWTYRLYRYLAQRCPVNSSMRPS